ncbi:MAG: DUF4430 domain-containing protein [Candidatus Dojkabacteria bacterium]
MEKFRKKKIVNFLAVVLVIALVAAVAGFIVGQQAEGDTSEKDSVQEQQQDTFTLVVEAEGQKDRYEIKTREGETLLLAMSRYAEENDQFSYKTETFSFGEFITVINEIDGSEESGNYWAISLDSEPAQVGVSELVPETGQEISFVLTSLE